MKAQVVREFGPASVFRTEELPVPVPGYRQVLIEVQATSVNPIDTKVRSGKASIFAPAFPAILHGDVAGVVKEVGAGVTGFRVGDRVFGCVGGVKGTSGALAEFIVSDEASLALMPAQLGFAEAASVPLVALTAWEGLVDKGKVQPGDHVLVVGGVGGVGQMAIQLALAAGATVDTTASSDAKAELATKLGAHAVVNYKQESLADFTSRRTQSQGYDIIFDAVGGQTLQDSFPLVRFNGKVIFIGTGESHDLRPAYVRGVSLIGVLMLIPLLTGKGREHQGQILKRVSALIASGSIHPVVDPVRFSFERVSEAHEYLESGRALGKVVITRA